MQTLKFKIKHEFEEKILNYQREYSSLLHSAFEFIKNNENKDSCFDYMKGSSELINEIKEIPELKGLEEAETAVLAIIPVVKQHRTLLKKTIGNYL